ncbi:hypothetical protein LCGC14_2548960, partial [marine sediment metagenome]
LRIEYTASVLKNFLAVYDSFKKALDAENNDAEKQLLTHFYDQFMNVFKSYDAKPIEVKVNDSFDYSLHEALTSVEKEDLPENNIIEIIQDGFKYGKEVIRYAKVIVSRKPKPPPEPEPEPELESEEAGEEESAEDVKVEDTSPQEDSPKEETKKKKKVKEKKQKKHKEDKKEEKSN